MLLGLLAGLVVFCLSVGALPTAATAALAGGTALLLWCFPAHHHHGPGTMDTYARRSSYAAWNPAVKVTGSLAVLLLCVASPHALVPLVLAAALAGLTVAGGVPWGRYLALLTIPGAFLLLSVLTLLWTYTAVLDGVLSVPFFGGYLTVTASAQVAAGRVAARALGGVSCLYFLSLSTPLPELFSVLRRLHLPEVVLDLMVLIYRYIFVLLSIHETMQHAAASRLGYGGLRQSLRTTGAVYGNLLAGSFRRAGACFDAMESRGYQGEIRFLEEEKPVTAGAVLVFAGLLLGGGALLLV